MADTVPLRDAWSGHTIQGRVLLLAGVGSLVSFVLLGGTAWLGLSSLADRAREERRRTAAVVAGSLDHLLRQDLAALAAAAADVRLHAPGADDDARRAALHAVSLRTRSLAGVAFLPESGAVTAAEPPRAPFWAAIERPEVAAAARASRPSVLALDDSRLLLVVPLSAGAREGAVAGVADLRHAPWSSVLAAAAPDGGSAELLDAAGRVISAATGRHPPPSLALGAAPFTVALRPPAAGAVPELRSSRLWLAAAGTSLFLLSLLFAWGTGRSLTTPLAVLTAEAERIAGGDLSRPVPDLGPDQAGRLGRAFERMRRELGRALDALLESRRELEARVAARTAELESLYRALRERDEQRGLLLRKVIAAQEDERKRIARELHDDTCQALAVLGMRLDALHPALPSGRARAAVAESRALVERTVDGVHRVIYDLRPSVLDDLGLFPAIRWLAARHLQPAGVAVECELEDGDERLPPETETALFRAAQEALMNVARHAGARKVRVRAATHDGELEISIEDDGCGFEPGQVAEASPSGRGLGLLGMRERLELLGGRALVDSAPGRGTRVLLRVPKAHVLEAPRA